MERFARLQTGEGHAVTISSSGVMVEEPRQRRLCRGFIGLESYIKVLVKTTRPFEALTLFTPEGDRGFAVWSRAGKIETFFTVNEPDDAGYERKIRSLFSSVGVNPLRDFVAENGAIPTRTRYLVYSLSGAASEITALAIRVLRDVYGIPEEGLLEIEYKEHKADL